MSENQCTFVGTLQTDGQVHYFSLSNDVLAADGWYIANIGTYDQHRPYLICIYGSHALNKRYEYRSWQYGDGYLPREGSKELEEIKGNIQQLRQKSEICANGLERIKQFKNSQELQEKAEKKHGQAYLNYLLSEIAQLDKQDDWHTTRLMNLMVKTDHLMFNG